MNRYLRVVLAAWLALGASALAEIRPAGAKIYLTRPQRAQLPGPVFIIPRRASPAVDPDARASLALSALSEVTPTPLPPRRSMRVYTSSASGGPLTIPISSRNSR